MLVCRDLRSDTGCGAVNPNGAIQCRQCGQPLRYCLQLHDPGDHIDHYHIRAILGIGGFGAVYQAVDLQQPGVSIALKETLNPTDIQAFQGEFAILRRLHHVNLPHYHRIFEAAGHGYLVMDFVPGQSLDDILKRQSEPLSERQVLGYALQLCDALGYLHRQQPSILHRDIKPANIRLTPEGLIKLVDFGLLKVGDGLTRISRRGLTPAYAPLEQYGGTGQHTDQRSDIYSLGATFYHLLTGIEPLPVTDRVAVSPDPLIPPRQINPTLSPQVSATVMKAMSLRPMDRYTDVERMEQAWIGQPPAAVGTPSQGSAAMPFVTLLPQNRSSATSNARQNRILQYVVGIAVALMVVAFTGKLFSSSPKSVNNVAIEGPRSSSISVARESVPASNTLIASTPIIQVTELVAQILPVPSATTLALLTPTATPTPLSTVTPPSAPIDTQIPLPPMVTRAIAQGLPSAPSLASLITTPTGNVSSPTPEQVLQTSSFRASSENSNFFGVVGTLTGEYVVKPNMIDLTLTSGMIRPREGQSYKGRTMIASITVGVATSIDNNGGWDIVEKSDQVNNIDVMLIPGDRYTLKPGTFSIPIKTSDNLSKCWLVFSLVGKQLDNVKPDHLGYYFIEGDGHIVP